MTICGIGVDIENISRFKKLPYTKNKSFYKKLFTLEEIEHCLRKNQPYKHFAVRFCAKEAFIKATSYKIKDFTYMKVIIKDKKPFILFQGKKYLLSISHDDDKAIAFVVVEK